MSGKLTCYSFHSVKGGVGKSTLSIVTALGLAQHRGKRVTLVDMDLTGTSLADVLLLEAPSWPGVDAEAPLDLLQPPTGFLPVQETRQRMELRDERAQAALERDPDSTTELRQVRGVPFLNDHLLFATQDWDAQRDVHIESMLWRMQGVSEKQLRVIPSSALPVDLERIIPVVFDENHSGFLESRLEYLLDALVPEQGEEAVIVVDTPPTIPGLSRAVISLALRLTGAVKRPISVQGGMPPRLEQAEVTWTAFLVGTEDRQDLRAANRWLQLASAEERRHIQFVVNRVRGPEEQVLDRLTDVLSGKDGQLDVLMERPRLVQDDTQLMFFRDDSAPAVPAEALAFLDQGERA